MRRRSCAFRTQGRDIIIQMDFCNVCNANHLWRFSNDSSCLTDAWHRFIQQWSVGKWKSTHCTSWNQPRNPTQNVIQCIGLTRSSITSATTAHLAWLWSHLERAHSRRMTTLENAIGWFDLLGSSLLTKLPFYCGNKTSKIWQMVAWPVMIWTVQEIPA